MSPTRKFRALIIAFWAASILSMIAAELFDSSMPAAISEFQEQQFEGDLPPAVWGAVVTGLGAVLLMVIGTVSLFRLHRQGRLLLLGGLILAVLTPLGVGVAITNPVSQLFDTTSMILGGVILGWAYLYDQRLPLSDGKTEDDVPEIPPLQTD